MISSLIKPIAGILTSRADLMEGIISNLAKHFGPADIIGDWHKFDHTRYYEKEMGTDLLRCFVSFSRLVPAGETTDFKRLAMEIETLFCKDNSRLVNIDPGYIDANKLVLVSGKHGGHKIAIAGSAFVDLLLWYDKGWKPMPWAFPDFRGGEYFQLFTKMRTKYKKQMREDINTHQNSNT